MAGTLTFLIGGTTFGVLANGQARNALAWSPGAQEYGFQAHHIPGVDGTLVHGMGRLGKDFRARVRYVGVPATVTALFETDVAAWSNAHLTLVDPAGTSWTYCRLLGAQPQPMAGGTAPFMDVEYTFRRDA